MTIAFWLVLGLILGLLAPIGMPTPVNHGRIAAAIVGLTGALIGGAIGAFFTNTSLMVFSGISGGTAAIAGLCVLFTYQCLEMRRT